jgi:RNase P subunit RPR2
MKKSLSKKEAEKQIEEFFHHIREKTPKDVKKIKRLAMSYNIKIGTKRKVFCKKCLRPFKEPGIRIKNGIVTFTCEFCKHQNRWKFKDRPELPEGDEEGCGC